MLKNLNWNTILRSPIDSGSVGLPKSNTDIVLMYGFIPLTKVLDVVVFLYSNVPPVRHLDHSF